VVFCPSVLTHSAMDTAGTGGVVCVSLERTSREECTRLGLGAVLNQKSDETDGEDVDSEVESSLVEGHNDEQGCPTPRILCSLFAFSLLVVAGRKEERRGGGCWKFGGGLIVSLHNLQCVCV